MNGNVCVNCIVITLIMLELAAFVVSLAYSWLLIKERRVGWLLCIASGMLYIVIYAQAKLYSDAELQLLYIAIGIYGYFSWGNKKENNIPLIHWASPKVFMLCIGVVVLMAVIWGGLHSFTDASFPYLDALLASTCIVAQWMMARKYFQNWYLWIFANIGYLWMYSSKGMVTTTVLYTIFFAVTMHGYFKWKRSLALMPANN
jgi:nicotinamide mononucleotide transporter